MTVHVETVARLRAYEEPNGSFAVDGSGTAGNFVNVPFIEGTATHVHDEPLETPGQSMQRIDAQPVKVHMPKRGRVTFDINLASTGLATGLRSQGALGRLLKIAMGGEFLGTSSTVSDASPSTTEFDVASAAGFREGGIVVCATGTGGRLEAREIFTISGSTITLKYALSGAPSNGSTVYSGATYYHGSRVELGDSDTGTSLQLIAEGLEPDDRWYYSGGQIASPPRLTLPVGGIPRLSFEWQFAQWFQADGANTAGDFVGPELGVASYTNYRVHVLKDSEFRVLNADSSAISNTVLHATAFEINPNLVYWPHLAPGGTNNIVQYIRQRAVPAVSGSFTLPFEDMTWHTARAADTRKAIHLQIGSSPTVTTGGGVLLTANTVQITDVKRVSIDGIAGQTVSWEGTVDVAGSSGTSLALSPFRIHLF